MIDHIYDPCAPLHVAVIDASADQRASLDDAIEMWRAVLPIEVTLDAAGAERVAADGAPGIALRFEPAALAFRGIYLDETSEIVINSELAEPSARAIAIAHELGHAFGMRHVAEDQWKSVMLGGNITTEPTDGDAAALARSWPSCR